ncbi:hypothetical protein OHA00_15545 [Streptomyces cellulosae]|nr:hypothetical protein OHA00_15545 [Streptomyces cellulosae]
MDDRELMDTFNSMQSRYGDLCSEIAHSLEKAIETDGIKSHSVTSRLKSLESFIGKTRRKGYTDPFRECEDIAAVRVVCLFMSDLERIRSAIERTFQVISSQDKISDSDAATFGYMSHHYICKLSEGYSGPRYDHISNLKFEIQVRTILMDAWANVSHYLSYKNEASVPQEMLKDFHALSGLLYVADRQFETLARASANYAARAERDIVHSGVSVTDLNADTVAALLLKLFPDRQGDYDMKHVSDFVSEVRSVGYDDLESLQRDIEAGLQEALNDEMRDPPSVFVRRGGLITDIQEARYARIGMARNCLKFSNPKYEELTDGPSAWRQVVMRKELTRKDVQES